MEIRRKDGAITDEDIMRIHEDVTKTATPLKEYEKISKLEGLFFSVIGGYVEIVKAIKNENEIIFTLRIGNCIIEEKAIYPISEILDKKDKVLTSRFLTFLEWHALKNIDKILL